MEHNKHKKKSQQKSKPIKRDRHDSGHGDSEAASTTTSASPSPVEKMTSRDFQFDTNAHIEMMNQTLKDSVRIQTFKNAILHNKHLFKDKQVLNIGCGIGIYALFAAKAGAAKVYAIDSSNVVYYTRKIVAANGFSNVIEVIKGKIEQVELPVKEVDIIVCDWMGYAMLFQSTCDSVIYARDKWLKKPGGLIFPDKAQLFMVALEDGAHKNENIDWWNNVYGFSMKPLRNFALSEPRYHIIRPQQILSKQCPIKSLDLNSATIDDLKLRTKYMLPIGKSGHMDGIALYFHVFFSKSHAPMGFSTDPWSPGTNWMQTILFFDETLSVNTGSIYYGGIEFFSPSVPCNLNDMIVNIEMLKGDPTEAEVDVNMTWRLKPITEFLSGPSSNSDNCRATNDTDTICDKNVNICKHYNKNDESTKNNVILNKTGVILNNDITNNSIAVVDSTRNQTFIKTSDNFASSITSTTNQFNALTVDNNNYMLLKNRRAKHQTFIKTAEDHTLSITSTSNQLDTLKVGNTIYPCRKNKRTKTLQN